MKIIVKSQDENCSNKCKIQCDDYWLEYKEKTAPSDLPTVNFEGIFGEDELSSQLTHEVGMKEFLPHYEGLFRNEIPIQEEQLLRIYTKLLKVC